jgi:transcriptional antiterminator RfaH
MAYWAVARTLPRRETIAAERLSDAGFEIFLPKIKTGQREEAVFAGYVFVRIGDTWRSVDHTAGVLGLIKFGEAPAKCPDAEIAKLKRRLDADGLIRPVPGAKVRITAGAFRGLDGIYAGQTARDRERVLLDFLGRQALVELRSGQIFFQAG